MHDSLRREVGVYNYMDVRPTHMRGEWSPPAISADIDNGLQDDLALG